KNSIGSRVNVVPAVVARIRRATSNAMMFCDCLALVTKDSIGIEVVLQPFQTSSIIWKLLVKLVQRVRKYIWFAVAHGVPALITRSLTTFVLLESPDTYLLSLVECPKARLTDSAVGGSKQRAYLVRCLRHGLHFAELQISAYYWLSGV